MFRVHFDERTGTFVLQVLRFHCLWRLVKCKAFVTYEDTVAHVKAIGLDKLYRDGSHNRLVEAMSRQ